MHVLIVNFHTLQARFIQRNLRYENISADTCQPENLTKIWYNQYDSLVIPIKTWSFPPFPKLLEILHPLGQVPIIIAHQTPPPPAIRLQLIKYPLIRLTNNRHSLTELTKTIKTIQANESPKTTNAHLKVGDLKMDLETKEVCRANKQHNLRNKEFSLLECLMRNVNRPLTRTFLLDTVWDRNTTILSNTVDVHINRLRKKIDHHQKQKMIKTVPMVGYKLISKDGQAQAIK